MIDIELHYESLPPEVRKSRLRQVARILWPDELLNAEGASAPAVRSEGDAPDTQSSEGQDDTIVDD